MLCYVETQMWLSITPLKGHWSTPSAGTRQMCLLSITSHLENSVDGVYVQVCMNLHMCGGAQMGWREKDTHRHSKEVLHCTTVSTVSRILIPTVLLIQNMSMNTSPLFPVCLNLC